MRKKSLIQKWSFLINDRRECICLTCHFAPLIMNGMEEKDIQKLISAMQDIFPTAEMVQRGFDNTATKDDIKRLEDRMDKSDERIDHLEEGMEHLDVRMDSLETHMDHMDARMGRMEADLNEIRSHIVYRHEFEDLMGRVKYIEKKLNIESGT